MKTSRLAEIWVMLMQDDMTLAVTFGQRQWLQALTD